MANLEVKQTLRLYDMEMVSEIARLHDEHRKEYRYKNDLFVELLRLGLTEFKKRDKPHSEKPEIGDTSKKDTPSVKNGCEDKLSGIEELLDAVAKYIFTQFKAMYISQSVTERLLSSIYRQLQEMHSEERSAIRNADAGFYDHLPERFEKIIINLKKTYGLE